MKLIGQEVLMVDTGSKIISSYPGALRRFFLFWVVDKATVRWPTFLSLDDDWTSHRLGLRFLFSWLFCGRRISAIGCDMTENATYAALLWLCSRTLWGPMTSCSTSCAPFRITLVEETVSCFMFVCTAHLTSLSLTTFLTGLTVSCQVTVVAALRTNALVFTNVGALVGEVTILVAFAAIMVSTMIFSWLQALAFDVALLTTVVANHRGRLEWLESGRAGLIWAGDLGGVVEGVRGTEQDADADAGC